MVSGWSSSSAQTRPSHRPAEALSSNGMNRYRRGQLVCLTANEWLKARQLADSYWLYVVWDPTTPNHELIPVPDPGHRLEHLAREVRSVSHIELPAPALR